LFHIFVFDFQLLFLCKTWFLRKSDSLNIFAENMAWIRYKIDFNVSQKAYTEYFSDQI